jgi:hypothetical protein
MAEATGGREPQIRELSERFARRENRLLDV